MPAPPADTADALLAALPPRQAAFVREYLGDLNATQAAVRAGYSAATAHVQGPRLLGNVRVAAAIAAAQADRATRVQLTADRVLEELAHLATSDIGEVLDFTGPDVRFRAANEIPERARRAIASFKVKRFPERVGVDEDGKPLYETCEVTEFKLYDKNSALEKALRHLGIAERAKDAPTDQDGEAGVLVVPAPIGADAWSTAAAAQQTALAAAAAALAQSYGVNMADRVRPPTDAAA